MSERTPHDILDQARRRIEARRQEERCQRAITLQSRFDRERYWRYVFGFVCVGLLSALLYIPGAALDEKLYAVVHGLVAQQHNVFLDGRQLPICARNIGIYGSFLITISYLWMSEGSRAGGFPSRALMILLALFVLIMAVDGFNSLFETAGRPQLYPTSNVLRTVTGVGMGITTATAIMCVCNRALRQDVDKTQPILIWRDLGGVMVFNGLMVLGVYSNQGTLYWPLAWLTFLGIVGELFLINLFVIALMMGYSGSITALSQLARPATIALLTNCIIIGSLALLRFTIER